MPTKDHRLGAPELEITPEMIEAGEELVREFEAGFDSAKEYAAKIYRAMERARPKSDKSSSSSIG